MTLAHAEYLDADVHIRRRGDRGVADHFEVLLFLVHSDRWTWFM